ncbi:MAG: YraN family protein [Acidobacteria bacterium]|nr:YraN family protein [Acidobacteriota bacterium]
MPEVIKSLLEHSEPQLKTTSEVGKIGEETAANYLIGNGFELVAANFKVPVGRNRKGVAVTAEIDLIAIDKETLCFIEVKTRQSELFSTALSAVDIRKQRQITRAARIYRKTFNITDITHRYDVITVVLAKNKAPQLEHFKGFWSESNFKKNIWIDELER